MSQHNIEMNSPLLGSVTITLGMDARLDEVFVTILGDDYQFSGPPGLEVDDLANVVQRQTKCVIPHEMLKGVRDDVAAFRDGAMDVNRRVVYYNADGSVASAQSW